MYLRIFQISVCLATFLQHFAFAFWWSRPSTTEAPATILKHIPLTYYRTFTYQPLYSSLPYSFPGPFYQQASHAAVSSAMPATLQSPILAGPRYDHHHLHHQSTYGGYAIARPSLSDDLLKGGPPVINQDSLPTLPDENTPLTVIKNSGISATKMKSSIQPPTLATTTTTTTTIPTTTTVKTTPSTTVPSTTTTSTTTTTPPTTTPRTITVIPAKLIAPTTSGTSRRGGHSERLIGALYQNDEYPVYNRRIYNTNFFVQPPTSMLPSNSDGSMKNYRRRYPLPDYYYKYTSPGIVEPESQPHPHPPPPPPIPVVPTIADVAASILGTAHHRPLSSTTPIASNFNNGGSSSSSSNSIQFVPCMCPINTITRDILGPTGAMFSYPGGGGGQQGRSTAEIDIEDSEADSKADVDDENMDDIDNNDDMQLPAEKDTLNYNNMHNDNDHRGHDDENNDNGYVESKHKTIEPSSQLEVGEKVQQQVSNKIDESHEVVVSSDTRHLLSDMEVEEDEKEEKRRGHVKGAIVV